MMIRTGRRDLLRSAAATTLAAPFLGAAARSVHAAGAPRRLVIIATPNTTAMDRFWPADGRSFGEILKPLEPLRSRVLAMRGINVNSAYLDDIPANHEPDFPNALTGRQRIGSQQWAPVGGISVDQHIANAIKGSTKMASLFVAVGPTDSGSWPLVAAGPDSPVIPEQSPQKAFSTLMGAVGGDALSGMVNGGLARLQAERRSILGFLKGEVKEVRCRISAADRPKLEAHLSSIEEVERSLSFQKATVASCRKAALGDDSFPGMIRSYLDMIVMALSCDLTRVIVLQADRFGSDRVHTWAGVNNPHHAIAHGVVDWTEPYQQLGTERQNDLTAKIESWYAQQVYYLCAQLEQIPAEDGKPLLDSCAVLWLHEQSSGHSRKDMPYVLVGSCGGYFRTGQFVRFAGTDQNSLASHNNLLVELAEAMGVHTPTFGDPRVAGPGFPELRA